MARFGRQHALPRETFPGKGVCLQSGSEDPGQLQSRIGKRHFRNAFAAGLTHKQLVACAGAD